MILLIVTIIVFFVVSLFSPDSALAWGPAVHIYTGTSILNLSNDVLPALAPLLNANPLHFFYGCLSADIFFGKNGKSKKNRCHTWEVGKKLLEASGSDPQKAYACGFLAHLAADTVAHNICLPYYMSASSKNRKWQHCFWEWHFDYLLARGYKRVARRVFRHSFLKVDRILCSLTDVSLPVFWTKKALFAGTLVEYGTNSRGVRSTLAYIYLSYHHKRLQYLENFIQLSIANAIDVLENPYSAACLKMNPLGNLS